MKITKDHIDNDEKIQATKAEYTKETKDDDQLKRDEVDRPSKSETVEI